MEDMVKLGEEIILNHKKKQKFKTITVNQLRKFLSSLNSIFNMVIASKKNIKENEVENDLINDDEITNQIRYLKVILVYGTKDKAVKCFIDDSKDVGKAKKSILERIDEIGNSRKRFLAFHQLMESIVAYHKYYGLKEQ